MARGFQELEIYADFKQDESYTPNKISVRAGNSFHDLRVRAWNPSSCDSQWKRVWARGAVQVGIDVRRILTLWLEEMTAQEIKVVDMEEPVGWVSIPLTEESSG
jgi:hypothetical protein